MRTLDPPRLDRSDRVTARANLAGWLAVLLLTVVVVAVYWPYQRALFAGADVLPSVESGRITSWADFVGQWTKPFMSESGFDASMASIYRPLVALTFALDYALWGLDGAGYHLTNLVLHLLTTLFLYAFLRQMRLAWWSALLGALVFALHPAMAAVVPGLARRHDVFAVAGILGSLALLGRAEARNAGAWAWDRVGAVVAFGVALLGKEPAFGVIPLLPLVLLAKWAVDGRPRTGWLGNLVRTLAPFAVVAVGVYALRYAILGGLGGYVGVAQGGFDLGLYRTLVAKYLFMVLWAFRDLAPPSALAAAILVLAAVVVLVLALAAMPFRQRVQALLGLAWVAGFGAFFVALKTLVGSWYMYYPLVGVALLVAAIAESLVILARSRRPAGVRGVTPLVAFGAFGLLVAGYLAANLLWSPAVHYYAVWEESGRLSQAYLEQARACVRDVPDGARVVFERVPDALEYGIPETDVATVSVFQDYSLASGLRLGSDGRNVAVEVASYVTLTSPPGPPALTCSGPPTARRISSGY